MSRLFPGLKASHSMRTRIGLLYLALSIVNIVVLTAMIFENQLDMLRMNFRLQSDKLAGITLAQLEGMDAGKIDELNRIDKLLSDNHVISFTIFQTNGKLLFERKESDKSVLPASGVVSDHIRRKTLQLRDDSTLIQLRYTLDLDEHDYSATYVMPLPASHFEGDQKVFLRAVMRIADFESRFKRLYVQAGFAAGLVFLVHLVFALIVGQIFFRRIGILASTSLELGTGNLDARAQWSMRNHDEIDLLGSTFNTMAVEIQSTVTKITSLNQDMQNELSIGKEVQEKFLPDLTKLKHWNAASYYKPLREVSGDVYMFYEMQGNPGIFFADAAGHGVSAALITSLALLSLERILEHGDNIATVAHDLNRAFMAHLKTAMFYMTGVLILYKDGKLHYVNGGHPSPLLLRKDGTLVELPANGPPFGIAPNETYSCETIACSPGDRILLYSDGLVETENAEVRAFGIETVRHTLLEHADSPVQDTVDALTIEFEAFRGYIRDDVSFLYLEIT